MAPSFLTSALDRSEWSPSRPGRFTPGERAPGTHWIGDWVGGVEKRLAPARNRASAVQTVTRRYTD
jgi:hypothetical protein